MKAFLIKITILTLIFLGISTKPIFANDQFAATITNVTESKNSEGGIVQWLELKKNNNADRVFVKNEQAPYFKYLRYVIGEKLLVQTNESGEYYIADYYRQDSLTSLFWVFVIVVLFVGKFYGFSSLFGMGVSLYTIIKIILPLIYSGANPIVVILCASTILIPLTFYLSHGINTKTHLAISGTFISAIITASLAFIFTHLAHLNGFGSEEASFLDIAKKRIPKYTVTSYLWNYHWLHWNFG